MLATVVTAAVYVPFSKDHVMFIYVFIVTTLLLNRSFASSSRIRTIQPRCRLGGFEKNMIALLNSRIMKKPLLM